MPDDVESTRRQLTAEANAARELAGRTRFATSEPVALGEPGAGYPLPWSVQTWVPGLVATDDPGTSVAFEPLIDVPRLRRMWQGMRELPREADDAMNHGDLIPGNVLVANGRLAGVIDVGGLGPADPALDLVAAWHLLDDVPRQALRGDLGCDDLEWERGKAWAFQQAMGAVWYYVESNPAMSRIGRRTLERILEATPAT